MYDSEVFLKYTDPTSSLILFELHITEVSLSDSNNKCDAEDVRLSIQRILPDKHANKNHNSKSK